MYSKKLSSDIFRHFDSSPKVILALSGGPDSVFLGELLSSVLPKEDIVVAHFDHKLRDDSENDKRFCEKWAQKKGLECVWEEWKNPQDSEEKARIARYDFLQEIAKKNKADAIVLGTHADDEAETIFFNFLRGTGISGLSGIKMFDEKTKLFRPLLHFTKKEILKYLKENDVEYAIDPTNLTSNYSRNFLRNEIFPQLEERFPGFSGRIKRQAKIFDRMNGFLSDSVNDFLHSYSDKFPKKEFLELHSAVQSEVLRTLFSPKNLDFEQTENVRNFIQTAESGKRMNISGKTILIYSEYFFVD